MTDGRTDTTQECGKPISLGVHYQPKIGARETVMPCALPAGHNGDCSWTKPCECGRSWCGTTRGGICGAGMAG